MLTWSVVLALALGVYAQRAAGALLVDAEKISDRWRGVLDALPLAIIASVVALATFTSDGRLDVDARIAGVAAAALCAWRRLPMFATVVVAAAVTAVIRGLA